MREIKCDICKQTIYIAYADCPLPKSKTINLDNQSFDICDLCSVEIEMVIKEMVKRKISGEKNNVFIVK